MLKSKLKSENVALKSESSMRSTRSMIVTALTMSAGFIAGSAQAAGGIQSPIALPFVNSNFGNSNLLSFQDLAGGLRLNVNADLAASLRAHPADTLVRAHSTIDGNLETRRYKHFRSGIEVLGSQALEHRDLSGTEISNELKNFEVDVTPSLSDQEAATIAYSRLGSLPLAGNPELKIAPNSDADDASARLVYVVQTQPNGYQSGQEVWVDAHTGEIVAHLKHEMRIAPTYVYSANMNCQSVDQYGEPNSINAESCKLMYSPTQAPVAQQAGADSDAVNAYSNAQAVLNYYSTVHGRNSYDNAGAKIINVVHIGQKFDNAFWSVDLKLMGYGDGDGQDMGNFTRALDVAGHEMTHGVTSETAQLSSQGESGALNEAFSDFFGVMVANKGNWRIGEALFLANHAGTPTQAIRDLANPASIVETLPDPRTGGTIQIKDPSTVAQKVAAPRVCGPENDFCWVHTNSTIPSHTSYLVAQKLGNDKAQKLMYLTLTHYLTPNSNFKSLKKSVMAACPKVLGTADCASVQQIYTAAGF